MNNNVFDYTSTNLSAFIEEVTRIGMKGYSRTDLIGAYRLGEYGVTLENFLDAEISLPTLEELKAK